MILCICAKWRLNYGCLVDFVDHPVVLMTDDKAIQTTLKHWVRLIPRIVSWFLVYLMRRTFYKSNKVFISSWTYGREFILLRDSLQKPRQIHVAYIIKTCYTCINCNLVCMKEREGRERRSEKCFKIIFLIKFLKFYIFVSFCFKSLLTE